MPLDFPSDPQLNDTYTFGGYTWKWDGYGWRGQTTSVITIETPTGVGGINGAIDPLSYNQTTKIISLKIKSGGGILGSNAGLLIDTSVVPVLAGENTFTGSNIYNGDVRVNGTLTASSFSTETFQLDDITDQINGSTSNFTMRHRGDPVPIDNAFRLLISVNGIIQGVRFPEYVWRSPVILNQGFWINDFGSLSFNTNLKKGSTFFGTVLAGDIVGEKYNYPFRALDILLGDI